MVRERANGQLPSAPLLNQEIEPSYYSWPKEEQVTDFHRKGWRLVSMGEVLRLGLTALRLGRSFARFS